MASKRPRLAGVLGVGIPLALILVALIVLINALAPRGGAAPTPDAFAAGASFDEAVARARENDLIVFAVATADWCAPCQSYKRGALADERVASWLAANAAPVLIDVTAGRSDLTDRLSITAIPASFVIDARGQVLDRWTGDLSARELLERLERSRAPVDAAADPKADADAQTE